MASFNRVILMGNLTRDPEVRYIPGGTAVTDIGLAVSRKWTDKQTNTKKEETTFVDVTLWGRQAEVAGEYLAKGRPVLIEGRLQLDQWDDKETGKKRSKLKVVGEHMQLLSSGGGSSQSQSRNQTPSQQASPQQSAPQQSAPAQSQADSFYDNAPGGATEEDVPF